MKHQLNKLNQMKYLLLLVLVAAILALVWFLNRSFVTITISPVTAKLTIDNAPLLVNRNGVGKTTLTPGTHTIKLEAENFLFFSREIDFKKGKKTNLSFTLKEKPEISSVETGARFVANGKNTNEIIYLDPSGTTLISATLALDSDQKIVATKTPITSNRLSGINQIIWSPSKDLAIFKKNDGAYLFDFQKYDFINQTENLWGKDIGDITWAPDNSKIAYFYASGAEKSLIFANVSNTEKTRIANLADLNINNPFLSWSPDSQYLIIIPRNKDYGSNKVYIYDTYAGSLKTITDIGDQVSANFSPDTSKIAYSTYSKGTGDTDPYIISVMNKDGSNQKSLNVRTSTENIVWIDSNTILSAEHSRSGNSETFSTRSLTGESQQETVQGISLKIVNQTLLASENKIVIYENADGVFGFQLH